MKYSVVTGGVGRPTTCLDNYDFIKHSSHRYFYQSNTPPDSVTTELVGRTFEKWRQAVLNDDPGFSWDQLCKFPYLKKSIEHEKELRFPLTFFNDVLLCGTGRYFTIISFFPDIPMDSVRIYDRCPDSIDPSMHQLTDMDQYQSILAETRSYIKSMAEKNYYLNFHLLDDIIVSSDISPTAEWKFPFVFDPPKDENLINKIRHIIKLTADRPIFSAIKCVAEVEV